MGCNDKAETYRNRRQVRQDELTALMSAIQIIKTKVSEKTQSSTIRFLQRDVRAAAEIARNTGAMESIEAAAEAADGAPAFLETGIRRRVSPHGDSGSLFVSEFLRKSGTDLKSTLLASLAAQVSTLGQGADPLAKVKVLIEELINRLLQEAANEAEQKGFCDKATAEAEQKRDHAASNVQEANNDMDKYRTLSTTLGEEIDAVTEFKKFSTENGISTKSKEGSVNAKTKQKQLAEDSWASAQEKLRDNTSLLKKSIKELIELKKSCVDTGMSYEERVARREDEIQSLKKATCILENYSKLGPDSLGEC